MNSLELVKAACRALDEKKAEDITVLDISRISVLADYFVIATGSNDRQMQALSDSVDETLLRAGFEKRSEEGYNGKQWILMDYGDVVIHIFNEETRSFYDLDRIWRDGVSVDFRTLL